MSDLTAKRERRQRERLAYEQGLARAERRQRVRAAALAGALGLLAVSAVTALLVFVGADGGGGAQAAVKGAFGQHYRGLDERRQTAGIPTMMQTMDSAAHFHPRLWVYVDGRAVPVPANIGIDPARDSMQMAGLHTHASDGTVHAEGVERATLGQFFAIWGVPFSAQRLGPHRATDGKSVRMWVNGEPSKAFGGLALRDKQRIVVSYARSDAPAPGGIDR